MFDTAVHNPYRFPPRWLNEGLAVYLSEGYTPGDRGRVEDAAAAANELIPLVALGGQFPTDSDRTFLAYAEAVSAIDYLVRTKGQDALVALVDRLRRRPDRRRGVHAARSARTSRRSRPAGWTTWARRSPTQYGPQPAPAGPLPPGWSGPAPTAGSAASPGAATPVASAGAAATAARQRRSRGAELRRRRFERGPILLVLALVVVVVVVVLAIARRRTRTASLVA